MRLLDTWTGQFVEKDPRDPDTEYAILSHTWDRQEQTYQELAKIQQRYAVTKHQPQSTALSVPSDPASAERHQDALPGTPPPPCSVSEVATTDLPTLPAGQVVSSSAVSPPHPSAPAPPSPTPVPPASASPPDAPPLSPLWDDLELSPKIRHACKVAREYGHRYLWIDSCCIDKTSSSELSEAINSMYQWYERAIVCFAFLADVPAEEDHEKKDSCFRRSRWFKRGWTLQELIAPRTILFLSKDWTSTGWKHTLVDLLVEVTHIGYDALLRLKPLRRFSVAQRLSWAAKRETTRVEDRAYSLLGLFDINMPTLYGEGDRAFRRLQEEIMRRIPDQSLFAWTSYPESLAWGYPTEQRDVTRDVNTLKPLKSFSQLLEGRRKSLFAPSPDYFSDCGGITPISREALVRRLRLWHRLHLPAAEYSSTPHGIRTQLLMMPVFTYIRRRDVTSWYPGKVLHLAILQCEHKYHPGYLLARVCWIPDDDVPSLYCCDIALRPPSESSSANFDLLLLSPGRFKRLPIGSIKTVYIPHTDEEGFKLSDQPRRTQRATTNLVLQRETRDALYAQGYTANLRGPDHDHPTTHWLTLCGDAHTIIIEYQEILGTNFTIEARCWRVETSGPLLETTEAGDHRQTVRGEHGTLCWTYSYPMYNTIGKLPSVQLPVDVPGTEGRWMHQNFIFMAANHEKLLIKFTAAETSSPTPIPVEKRSWTRACKRWFEKLAA